MIKLSKPQESIQTPTNVEIRLEDNIVVVNGPKGEISKKLNFPKISLKKKNSRIIIEAGSSKSKSRAFLGTAKSLIQNMIKAVTEGFTYKMRIVYAHFPISLKIKDDRVEIHNFLGERKPRVADIVGDTEVRLEGDEITVSGLDKEEVSQTVANIEQATQINRRDPRVFQDGIYVVEEPWK